MGCSTFRQPDTNVPRWHLPGALQKHSAGDLEAAFSSTAAAKVRGEGLVGALQTPASSGIRDPVQYRRQDQSPINPLPKGHDQAPRFSRFMGYLLRFSLLPLKNGS